MTLTIPPSLEPLVTAVKKLIKAETDHSEALKEIEHLGVPLSAVKKKTAHVRALVSKKAKSKGPTPAKKIETKAGMSTEAWARYAQDTVRQNEVLDVLKNGQWNSIRYIIDETGFSGEGVRLILNELLKQKKVKKVKKKGNPNHSAAVKQREFEYWEVL